MISRRNLVQAAGLALLLGRMEAVLADDRNLGRTVRAALLTGGDYDRYRRVLISFAEGLKTLGIIDQAPKGLDPDLPGTDDVWKALNETAGGSNIRFLADGHYNCMFDSERRRRMVKALADRVNEVKDVDVIFVFGTETTLEIAELVKDVPVLSLASTDPVATGIVLSAEDSGQDNLHALVSKGYFHRQVESFVSVRPFRSLGFVTARERAAKSGVGDVRAACVSLGVTLVDVYYDEDEKKAEAENFPAFYECLENLVDKGVEAVLLPWFPCTDAQLAKVVELLVKRGVWSYSLAGPAFTSRGILLGAGEETLDTYGLFEADVLRRVIDGDTPREISQIFVQPNKLSLNLRTAMQMGWRVPFGLLVSVERTYTTQSIEIL